MSAALTTNVDQRLLRTTKFPPEFNVRVDMTKVNTPVIKKWMSDEIAKILQNDDDVVTELVFNIVEGQRFPNIKAIQIAIGGFLGKEAPTFSKELWKLCISAQENPQGIPKELLEAKKLELIQERLEEDKAREEAGKRQEAERAREREIARIRDRERSDRGRGRGGQYGRDFDRRPPPRDSRSPPPRRRDGDDYYRAPPPRDTYVPPSSRAYRNDRPRRHRSPSASRSPTRSRSPPRRRRRVTSSPASLRSPPPRKARSPSRDRSRSRDRGHHRGKLRHSRGDRDHRARSPPRRCRSPSPGRRRHHRSLSRSDDSRSPPPKRARRHSPSRSRSPRRSTRRRDRADNPASLSRSRSPPRRKHGKLAPDDLMSRPDRRSNNYRRDTRRLSREPSARSSSRSRTPPSQELKIRGSAQRQQPGNIRRNTSSQETAQQAKTKAGAESQEVGDDS